MPRDTDRYISVNLTQDAAKQLRNLCAEMTIARGKRVTTSELELALLALAEQHRDTLIQHLTNQTTEAVR
jgi:hypothetical protein